MVTVNPSIYPDDYNGYPVPSYDIILNNFRVSKLNGRRFSVERGFWNGQDFVPRFAPQRSETVPGAGTWYVWLSDDLNLTINVTQEKPNAFGYFCAVITATNRSIVSVEDRRPSFYEKPLPVATPTSYGMVRFATPTDYGRQDRVVTPEYLRLHDIGDIKMNIRNTVPPGWIRYVPGAEYLKADYQEFYDLCSNALEPGSTPDKFKLPSTWGGRAIGIASTNAISTAGNATVTVTTAEDAGHIHEMSENGAVSAKILTEGSHFHMATSSAIPAHTHVGRTTDAGGHDHGGNTGTGTAHDHTFTFVASNSGASGGNTTIVTQLNSVVSSGTITTSSESGHRHSISPQAAHNHPVGIDDAPAVTPTITVSGAGTHEHIVPAIPAHEHIIEASDPHDHEVVVPTTQPTVFFPWIIFVGVY